MIRQATHEKFDMDLVMEKKVFFTSVRGFYNIEDGADFLDNYNKIVKKINPREYSFVLECEDLKTLSQEMTLVLENCFDLYKATRFKKVYCIEPSSSIALIQLKKIQRTTGLDVEFVKEKSF